MAIPVFPTLKGLTFPTNRMPIFRTAHQEAVSGADNPIELWSYPRWQFEVSYTFLRSDIVNAEWQALAAFFLAMRGSSRIFRWTEPDDSSVTDQPFGTGDGTTVAFPLVRTLTGGGFTFTEPVFAPTITNVKVAGGITAAYTLGTQGLVTFNVAPTVGQAITWTGSYDWVCRFDSDQAAFSRFAYQFWELKKIVFTSAKLQSK